MNTSGVEVSPGCSFGHSYYDCYMGDCLLKPKGTKKYKVILWLKDKPAFAILTNVSESELDRFTAEWKNTDSALNHRITLTGPDGSFSVSRHAIMSIEVYRSQAGLTKDKN